MNVASHALSQPTKDSERANRIPAGNWRSSLVDSQSEHHSARSVRANRRLTIPQLAADCSWSPQTNVSQHTMERVLLRISYETNMFKSASWHTVICPGNGNDITATVRSKTEGDAPGMIFQGFCPIMSTDGIRFRRSRSERLQSTFTVGRKQASGGGSIIR